MSLIFFYTGLVPDLAIIRDRTTGVRRKVYGYLALGWTGSHKQWHHYAASYLLLAGLATALVISVHTVVSWDFALPIQPGWHSTIFPPYFVAGAIHSGLAMVLTLLIPMRRIFRIEHIVTTRTLELIAETMLLTTSILVYSYLVEHFMAWYSGNIFEQQIFNFRIFGYYAWVYWLVVGCAVVCPLLFFFRPMRTASRASLHHLDLREHRHVVGEVLHRHPIPIAELPPFPVGVLLAELGGARLDPGDVLFSFLCLYVFREIPALHPH